jgi:hypothetical protein
MITRSYRYVSILAIALLAGLAGCAQGQNAEQLKERWNRDKRLDLNTATKEQLMVLPGMTAPEADKVIAGRPYENAGELVMRGILPKNEYDKIADGSRQIYGGPNSAWLDKRRIVQLTILPNLRNAQSASECDGADCRKLATVENTHSPSKRRAGECRLPESG